MAMIKAEVKLFGASCLEQNARTAWGSCRWYLEDTKSSSWVTRSNLQVLVYALRHVPVNLRPRLKLLTVISEMEVQEVL